MTDSYLFFIVSIVVGIIAVVAGFLWISGIVMYYKDETYRTKFGRPMFWPFPYNEDR